MNELREPKPRRRIALNIGLVVVVIGFVLLTGVGTLLATG